MKKKLLFILTVLLIVCTVAACGTAGGKLAAIQKNGKLVMYTNANFRPYEYMEGTEIMGVDVDIAREIAKDLEVELEIQNADFDGLVTSIASGKGDIAISGMTITEKRKKEVDFSKPYTKSSQYLILLADSNLTKIEELEGKRVGDVLGYTGQILIDDEVAEGVLQGKTLDRKSYKSAMEASMDLKNGKLDAVVMDELVAKMIVDKDSTLKAEKLFYANGDAVEEEYGIAVAKGNEDLLEKLNATIDRLTASGKINEFILAHSNKNTEG